MPGLTKIQNKIRKHAALLLKTPEDGSLASKVTKGEADGYDPLRQNPPFTADNFRLYLEGTPAHPWNKAATKVFAADFCAKFPQHTVKGVELHFKVHLESLIRKYRMQQKVKDNQPAQDDAKKKNRKSSRRSAVSPLPWMRFLRLRVSPNTAFERA